MATDLFAVLGYAYTLTQALVLVLSLAVLSRMDRHSPHVPRVVWSSVATASVVGLAGCVAPLGYGVLAMWAVGVVAVEMIAVIVLRVLERGANG